MRYYVDAIAGSDAFDGLTAEKPFRTLTRAAAAAKNGAEAILFRAGCMFYGMLEITKGGTEEKILKVGRYGEGRNPVINACNERAGVFVNNTEYVEISDLEITNTAPEEDARRCGVLVECGGENTQGGNFRHIHIIRVHVHHIVSEISRQAGGIIFDTLLAENPVTYEDVLIESCRVGYTEGNGITFTSVYGKRIGIDWATGEYTPSKKVVIRNNVVHDCGGDGIFQTCALSPVIEHNLVYRTSWAGNTAYAGIWPHNSYDAVMQYNEAFGQRLTGGDGQGYDVDIDCERTIVQYNYSHDNDGGFLLICTSGDQGGYNRGVTVRHNVSENDKGQIFTLSGPVTDINIHDNKISFPAKHSTRLIGMYQWAGKGGGPDLVAVENNDFNINGNGKNQFYQDTRMVFRGNCYQGDYDISDIPENAE